MVWSDFGKTAFLNISSILCEKALSKEIEIVHTMHLLMHSWKMGYCVYMLYPFGHKWIFVMDVNETSIYQLHINKMLTFPVQLNIK